MGLFIVTTEARNQLGLRVLCQQYVNDLWIPTDLNDEQAAAFALDQFQRTILAELKMLEVSCKTPG